MSKKKMNQEDQKIADEISGEWKKVVRDSGEMNDFTDNAQVEGKLVDIRSSVGPNNSFVYTLEAQDSARVSFWGNTVLDGKFKNVDLGTYVKVEYTGMVESKNGRSYKNFEVYTKS